MIDWIIFFKQVFLNVSTLSKLKFYNNTIIFIRLKSLVICGFNVLKINICFIMGDFQVTSFSTPQPLLGSPRIFFFFK